ncbi:MAG: DNA replication and repair protein RecF [Armatimonadetes bacterium]|nr:DNA replication and repair protein RecF [Armatimonadota bacterium]
MNSKSNSLLETSGENAGLGVRTLRIRDFRNIASLDLELDPKFNVIHGRNAQGKTNLLESVFTLGTTRLLRDSKGSLPIRHGANEATIEAGIKGGRTELKVEFYSGTRRRAAINGLGLPRASDLIGRLPVVCISVEDLSLVRGERADRRLFLDLEISTFSPRYLQSLATYKRAVEQRNALLRMAKEGYVPPESFEVWEIQIAEHGAHLREARLDFVRELSPHAMQVHETLGQGEQLTLEILPSDDLMTSAEMLEGLEISRNADIGRGGTSVGPHRDDLLIAINGDEVRHFGSQGQQRTAVISVKMATLNRSAEHFGRVPVLLLDDILSDLDERRRALLIELVHRHADQAILTCTEASAAGERILSLATVWTVEGGSVSLA